jgi:hypothetical protein
MYGGSQATDLNARTGEFTPPGMTLDARVWSWRLTSRFSKTLSFVLMASS